MKEATGELNMTVVTIIAVGAVIALFWALWPSIQKTIGGTWNTVGGQVCTTDPNTGTMSCGDNAQNGIHQGGNQ